MLFVPQWARRQSRESSLRQTCGRKCGLKIVISNSAKGKYECSATVQDILSMRRRFELDPHEALYSLLAMSMEAERVNLPMPIVEGIVMTDYNLDGENIVITAEMD